MTKAEASMDARERPTTGRGDERKAQVTVAVAPLLGEPRAAASLTSQYVAGQALDILETRDDWHRVRGGDKYEGWMHRGYIGPPAAGSRNERVSLGCVVRSAAGRRRALPLCALLDADDTLLDGDAVSASERAAHFPREGSAIAGSAIRFFEGTSYLWGGVTPWGADCSGLVQTVFALHGVSLPRDAGDQGRCGIDIPSAAETLAAGDLLFFSDREDGRITHVGIAIGGARMVHLALGRGGYAIETLLGDTDEYGTKLRTRVRFARRVLG